MLATFAALLAFAPYHSQDDTNGVPKDLLGKLTTGVNITRWFCYLGGGDQDAHFANYLQDADYKNFAKLGVKFVRLCISPDMIYNGGKPSDKLSKIDAGLDHLFRHHLTVIWDLHDNGQLGLDKPGQDNSGLVSFWSAIATHYKGSHYSDLVFEVVNEPVFVHNPEDWYPLQAKAVAAIRDQDPNRTIMVSPTYWSSIDTLQKMPVLAEKNLIYTVHCYDPFYFTHQGAEWIDEIPKNLNEMPFPSSPELVAEIRSKNDPKYSATLNDYGNKHYDAAFLLSRLKQATDWGAEHHVPILLGEFGAYPKVSPPESRARWFDGMKSAISNLKLPNSIWGYDEGLGLGRTMNSDGSISLDPLTLRHFFGVQSQSVSLVSGGSGRAAVIEWPSNSRK
jgi:endoglucanase